jgi:hypothetical protein
MFWGWGAAVPLWYFEGISFSRIRGIECALFRG